MKSSLLAQFASAGDSESGDSGCSSTSAKKLIPNSSTKRYRGLLAYGFAKVGVFPSEVQCPLFFSGKKLQCAALFSSSIQWFKSAWFALVRAALTGLDNTSTSLSQLPSEWSNFEEESLHPYHI
ncbi:uncharacterized protein LOC121995607 isoform X1 [Zingiber officinale]|uniref:uncharacterized protein LOC121995607 isoform X1 n=1 Tax=Zingiber officinale TaxID=94328 RepID=UPI001C4B0F44|nr:uncharacterized protein LOC121995607 isoform X1 [Zingiber officinale]